MKSTDAVVGAAFLGGDHEVATAAGEQQVGTDVLVSVAITSQNVGTTLAPLHNPLALAA